MDEKRLLCYRFTMRESGIFTNFRIFILLLL